MLEMERVKYSVKMTLYSTCLFIDSIMDCFIQDQQERFRRLVRVRVEGIMCTFPIMWRSLRARS